MNLQFDQLQSLQISVEKNILSGDLFLPTVSKGIIIFAHGSGSSRLSPRNRHVAKILNDTGFATLLFDLLTSEEEKIDNITAELRFNIPLLAERLIAVTTWIHQQELLKNLSIGYFGASTGAGAALIAAAKLSDLIKAVVSRGGRPDLADKNLSSVTAPTLLIVGELDATVIELNQQAQSQMQCINELVIIPRATHLFEEPGTLDKVTQLACNWFEHYLKL